MTVIVSGSNTGAQRRETPGAFLQRRWMDGCSLLAFHCSSPPFTPFPLCHLWGAAVKNNLISAAFKITNYLRCAHVCTMFRKAFEYFKHSSQAPPVESQAEFHQLDCGSISVKMELRWGQWSQLWPTIADWWESCGAQVLGLDRFWNNWRRRGLLFAAAWQRLLSLWFFTSKMFYSYRFSCAKLHTIR